MSSSEQYPARSGGAHTAVADARERGICPRCKDGNGTVWDGGGSRVDCPSCEGGGTWEAFARRRAFVNGWNAAIAHVQTLMTHAVKDRA